MKPAIILLSLLVAALTWWWHGRPMLNATGIRGRGSLRRIINSLLAGVIVYFLSMFIAMIWLLVTT